MKNWEEDDDEQHCAAAEDLDIAEAVCDRLQIPLHKANFSAEYWQNVFRGFLDEIEAGRTPNPDIVCNKKIKFEVFPQYAKQFNADFIATGHYVQREELNGKTCLLRGVDSNKDQSYFLHSLNQSQLSRSYFPIGKMLKDDVRQLAKQAGLPNYAKRDSTGICFIGERKFLDFMRQYIPAKPGPICTPEGTEIGIHQGVFYYTLGQRKGLGIGGINGSDEGAWYISGKDIDKNTLIAVQDHGHPMLLSRRLLTYQVNWISGEAPKTALMCTAKTRYRQQDQTCVVKQDSELGWLVEFDQPQRAVTPGQSVVFYQGEICLGGGIIESTSS